MKTKSQQIELFQDGADLPLMSGVPIKSTYEPHPQPAASEGHIPPQDLAEIREAVGAATGKSLHRAMIQELPPNSTQYRVMHDGAVVAIRLETYITRLDNIYLLGYDEWTNYLFVCFAGSLS